MTLVYLAGVYMSKNTNFIREQVEKGDDINLSDANRSKIANWLWNN